MLLYHKRIRTGHRGIRGQQDGAAIKCHATNGCGGFYQIDAIDLVDLHIGITPFKQYADRAAGSQAAYIGCLEQPDILILCATRASKEEITGLQVGITHGGILLDQCNATKFGICGIFQQQGK